MKITKSKLQEIIQEEFEKVVKEIAPVGKPPIPSGPHPSPTVPPSCDDKRLSYIEQQLCKQQQEKEEKNEKIKGKA
tara:strand:- start:360 stop:587 length:228 start_codon:yes stop_codon:yes gene_type:complete